MRVAAEPSCPSSWRPGTPTPQSRISPTFSAAKLDNPSVDDVIDVFEDRIRGWLLEPAHRLCSCTNGEFAAISILCMYPEGIYSYLVGAPSKRRSREFFTNGFVAIFSKGNAPEELLRRVAGVFYDDARCGSFHAAMFRERIFFKAGLTEPLHVTFPRVNGVVDSTADIQSILVGPKAFLEAVQCHFSSFIARLRDKGQVAQREKFFEFCRREWDWEGPPRYIGS